MILIDRGLLIVAEMACGGGGVIDMVSPDGNADAETIGLFRRLFRSKRGNPQDIQKGVSRGRDGKVNKGIASYP